VIRKNAIVMSLVRRDPMTVRMSKNGRPVSAATAKSILRASNTSLAGDDYSLYEWDCTKQDHYTLCVGTLKENQP
jgi:hypothetical protein